jgi:hypothetical protein
MRSQLRRGAFAVPRPTSLARILDRDATLSVWADRHRHELRLTAALRDHLPRPVAAQVRVSSTAAGILTLAGSSGAIAAAVRQRTPELLAALRREGWDFTEIKVRVQVRGLVDPPVKTAGNQRDARGADALFDLSATLAEGPLRASIQRWSRRARGR